MIQREQKLIALQKNASPSEQLPFRVSKDVLLSKPAFVALKTVAEKLKKCGLEIIIKRGYFPLDRKRKIIEFVAKAVFFCLYPHRHRECNEIFSAHQHETGHAVDIGIYDQKTNSCVVMLGRINVFTPKIIVNKIHKKNQKKLSRVIQAMASAGFQIHAHPVEQLQMHFTLLKKYECFHTSSSYHQNTKAFSRL